MTTLYIANRNYSSWSLRPWLLMQELDIPFSEQLIPFGDRDAWNRYRRRGGSGKVPMLEKGGHQVWDSLAIIETLAEDHPGVWPSQRKARAWARSACAEMHSGFQALRDICTMNIGVIVRLTSRPGVLNQDMDRILTLWQQGLEYFGGPFLAGDRFTAVDAFFAPVVFRFRGYGLPAEGDCQAYLQRMLALPGMREWERQALAEPWREAGHEAQTLRHGTLVEDRRVAMTGPAT